jgi:two-component SAPR family response regulator
VCIGTYSFATPPAEKTTLNLPIDKIIFNSQFDAFKTAVAGMGTKAVKFVVKAVTKDALSNVVNRSIGGTSSVKANIVTEQFKDL